MLVFVKQFSYLLYINFLPLLNLFPCRVFYLRKLDSLSYHPDQSRIRIGKHKSILSKRNYAGNLNLVQYLSQRIPLNNIKKIFLAENVVGVNRITILQSILDPPTVSSQEDLVLAMLIQRCFFKASWHEHYVVSILHVLDERFWVN